VLRLRDRGMSIVPEMLPDIFELFAQSNRALGHSSCGLGIGVAQVRRLVEVLGGSVSACSAGAGQGNEFVVRLLRTAPSEDDRGAGDRQGTFTLEMPP
jgi:signal transduction histidine kinase